jgi:RNA-binding protein
MMTLTPKARQQLKAKAHKLKPIVFIGNNGLTENIHMEVDRGLHDHELIKVRIQGADKELRTTFFTEICKRAKAHPVQLIGGVGIIYRKNEESDI